MTGEEYRKPGRTTRSTLTAQAHGLRGALVISAEIAEAAPGSGDITVLRVPAFRDRPPHGA
jgi:hypothetical protein